MPEEPDESQQCVQRDGDHEWQCFDNYGHPTLEQLCYCNAPDCESMREHPSEAHRQWHIAEHLAIRERLPDGPCWCVKNEAERLKERV